MQDPTRQAIIPVSITGKDRRRTPRFDLPQNASVSLRRGERQVRCGLRDISRSGMQIDVPELLDLGGTLAFEVRDGECLYARRAWQNGQRIGVSFQSDRSELEHMLLCTLLVLENAVIQRVQA